MKVGHKEGTQKQKVRKVHFASLKDTRHIQKVRVHPGECSREQPQVWKLSSPDDGPVHELPEKIDEAGIRADNLNWYNQ